MVFHGFSSPGAAPGAVRASKIEVGQGSQRIAGRQSQSSRPFEQATRAMPGQIEPARASLVAQLVAKDERARIARLPSFDNFIIDYM